MSTIIITTEHYQWKQKDASTFLILNRKDEEEVAGQIEVIKGFAFVRDASGHLVSAFASDFSDIVNDIDEIDAKVFIALGDQERANEVMRIRRETYQHLACFYEAKREWEDELNKIKDFITKTYGKDGVGLDEEAIETIVYEVVSMADCTEDGFNFITKELTRQVPYN